MRSLLPDFYLQDGNKIPMAKSITRELEEKSLSGIKGGSFWSRFLKGHGKR